MILFQPRLLVVLYFVLWCLFFLGEIALSFGRRAKAGRAPEDRGFFSLVWVHFLLTNLLAVLCLRFFPAASFGTYSTSCIGLGLMLAGLLLRWWAIIHLGRFFTVDVAVAADQNVVDSGPYKLVRHPSYTGALLVVTGLGICFGNFASIVALLVPFAALMLRRMRIEEAALSKGLGDSYLAYMNRTKRLFPGVY